MQSPRTRAILTVAIAACATFWLCACRGSSNPEPQHDPARLQVPSPSAVTRTSIPELLGTTDTFPVGLTITPDTEQLVLLDARQGVYMLDAERRFRRVADSQSLREQSTNGWDFTDIAALGSDQFALTALNDGFLLDLADGSLRQHFCYVPGSFLNPTVGPIQQLTNGVAFNPLTGHILAQPVTYREVTGMPIRSDIGVFPITGGEGDDWHPIDDMEFLADAITVDRDGVLWLARGNNLYQYDLVNDDLTFVQSLERFRVSNITGMVFDNDDLLVIDITSRALVSIPAALL